MPFGLCNLRKGWASQFNNLQFRPARPHTMEPGPAANWKLSNLDRAKGYRYSASVKLWRGRACDERRIEGTLRQEADQRPLFRASTSRKKFLISSEFGRSALPASFSAGIILATLAGRTRSASLQGHRLVHAPNVFDFAASKSGPSSLPLSASDSSPKVMSLFVGQIPYCERHSGYRSWGPAARESWINWSFWQRRRQNV